MRLLVDSVVCMLQDGEWVPADAIGRDVQVVILDHRYATWSNSKVWLDVEDGTILDAIPPSVTMITCQLGVLIARKQNWLDRLRHGEPIKSKE